MFFTVQRTVKARIIGNLLKMIRKKYVFLNFEIKSFKFKLETLTMFRWVLTLSKRLQILYALVFYVYQKIYWLGEQI